MPDIDPILIYADYYIYRGGLILYRKKPYRLP